MTTLIFILAVGIAEYFLPGFKDNLMVPWWAILVFTFSYDWVK